MLTIGGGEILDPSPRRRRKKEGLEDLKVFERGSLEEKLSMKVFYSGVSGVILSNLEGWIKAELPDINEAVKTLIKKTDAVQIDNRLLHKDAFDAFSQKILSTIKNYHEKNPLRPGIPKENLRAVFRRLDQRLFDGLLSRLQDIESEKEIVRLKTFKISLSEDSEHIKEKILKILRDSAFQPLTKEELAKAVSAGGKNMEELLRIMVSEGNLVRINDTVYLPSVNYAKMLDSVKSFYKKKPEMTVGEFRDILGTTRKYALPFLEYLDSNKITLRVGDVRKLLVK